MATYEATFEIDSKSDSYAVRRLLEQVYDAVREETRSVRAGSSDDRAVLEEFDALQRAARDPKPGRLVVTYECRDEEFDGTSPS